MQTLHELQNRFELYGVCVPCQRMERIPMPPLITRFGLDANVNDLRGRLRCNRCGVKRPDLRIVYAGAGGRAGRFQYRG